MLSLRIASVALVTGLLLAGAWAWAFTAAIVLLVLWHMAAEARPAPPPRRRPGMPGVRK